MQNRRGPKKLSPDLQAKLAIAEAESQRFNSMKSDFGNKISSVYPTNRQFNLQEELEVLKNNNIISKDLANKTLEEAKMPGKTPEQMEHDALEAAGFTAQAAQMEVSEEKKENEVVKNNLQAPLTEDQKFEAVATELKSRFGDKAPSVEKIRQWKQMYGAVFVQDFGEKYIFLYRYINRQEWKQINSDESWGKMPSLKQEEYIVNKCLLFPQYTIEDIARLPGGAYTTLSEQIQLQSMFLPAELVAGMTIKL